MTHAMTLEVFPILEQPHAPCNKGILGVQFYFSVDIKHDNKNHHPNLSVKNTWLYYVILVPVVPTPQVVGSSHQKPT